MPSTRSSARQAAQKTNSNPSSASQTKPSPATGSKRKTSEGGATGKAKKGRKAQGKEQQTTIEDAMPDVKDNSESKDVEMKDAIESKKEDSDDVKATETEAEAEAEQKGNGTIGDDAGNGEAATEKEAGAEASKPDNAPAKKQETITNGESKDEEPKKNGFDTLMSASANSGKADTNEKTATPEGTGSTVPPSANAVEECSERADSTPSSILEKGLIYFFFRGRVGIDEPSSPTEIARSYIILRPIPHSSKITDGPIGDTKNSRLLALPKKVLPLSPKDRFMVFVEKSSASMDEIKTQLSSSDYTTKTAGARHTPAAAPIGEGVYAITSTGKGRGETHLAYILTRPEEVGEVQRGVGLKKQGSFITSAKNPTAAAPAEASLPKGPEYPKE